MGGDIETRIFELLGRYRITPQTTTGESPAQMLMSRTPRFRLDLLLPGRENRVLQQQEKAQETTHRSPSSTAARGECHDDIAKTARE